MHPASNFKGHYVDIRGANHYVAGQPQLVEETSEVIADWILALQRDRRLTTAESTSSYIDRQGGLLDQPAERRSCMEVDVPLSGRGALYPMDVSGQAGLMDSLEADCTADVPDASGTLDCVREAFWQAYRHLFPSHSLAAQTPQGAVVISWSVFDEPSAVYPYATPVLLRFDPALLDAMWRCDAAHRLRIAQRHEPTVREGLRGYDPFAQFPNARVVTLG
jgi:hypothetical protein